MRFRVVETTGWAINDRGGQRTSGAAPRVFTVLDSAVGYRICGEFAPNAGGKPSIERRRAQAHALAAELEAAYP